MFCLGGFIVTLETPEVLLTPKLFSFAFAALLHHMLITSTYTCTYTSTLVLTWQI